MGVGLEDIKKLRTMTGAGLGDCKKALAETNGNIEEAVEIIRKKGQAVAAKRSDREAAEGAVLVKQENGFSAIIALKCETDFVAKNEDFVKLAQDILDLAVANKCKSLDEVKALQLGDHTVADAVTDRAVSRVKRWNSTVTTSSKVTTFLSMTTWVATCSARWFRRTSPLKSRLTTSLCRLQR